MGNKGLLVHVYRSDLGDCTNGGLSGKFNTFVLIDDANPVFEATADMPALKLVRRMIGSTEYLHVEPVAEKPEGNVGYMSGGNFVYSCDSRFPSKYPISVHDRSETVETYNRLTV